MIPSFKDFWAIHPNVMFIDSIIVDWGRYTVVQAELTMLQKAVDYRKFTAAIILCGATMPLKPVDAIEKSIYDLFIQKKLNYVGSISNHLYCIENNGDTAGCRRSPARCLNQNCTEMSLTPLSQPWYQGTQWTSFSYEFANYSLNSPIALSWADFMQKYFNIADESYFPTLVFNSEHFLSSSSDLSLVYFKWHECHTRRNVRSGNSPCYLGDKDYIEPFAENFLFARKHLFDDPIRKTNFDKFVVI